MTLKVGVLLGGRSAEREVSLKSGEAVYQALLAKGHRAVKIDVDENIAENLKREKIDVAFLALHGRFGEDGSIQGLLELLNIPYTGSGILASALAMNKVVTKKLLNSAGLPTPEYVTVSNHDLRDKGLNAVCRDVVSQIGLPLVVKPPDEGSSIGVTFVHREDRMGAALEEAFRRSPVALIERMVSGVEVTASVLGNLEPVALPLIEIVSATGVYDYRAKYTPGLSEHIIPPRLPGEVQDTIKNLAIQVYKTIGCRGFARVDFIIDGQNRPFILEINTIPGMTEVSLFPDAARAAGIEFPDLVEKILQLALEPDQF